MKLADTGPRVAGPGIATCARAVTSAVARRWSVRALLVACSLPAYAFEGDIHQQLTFIAARQFNNCAHLDQNISRYSALDTRYIVKANVSQAEGGWFGRVFRWNYYNRADQTGKTAWGLVDTRFHEHFEALVDETRWTVSRQKRLKNVGRILSYVQDMSSPARVVPVFTGRWWRFSVGDKFDLYRMNGAEVEAAVDDMCAEILGTQASFQEVLEDAARQTLQAVQAPIFGLPTTWEAFWKLADKADEFGEYGPAGNSFGDRTGFRCGDQQQRCLLLKNDPLYRDFATARHIAATVATMRVMALMQYAEADRIEQTTAR